VKSFLRLHYVLPAALLAGTLAVFVGWRVTLGERTDYAIELAQIDAALSDLDRSPRDPEAGPPRSRTQMRPRRLVFCKHGSTSPCTKTPMPSASWIALCISWRAPTCKSLKAT
jgi:hypothetical protein